MKWKHWFVFFTIYRSNELAWDTILGGFCPQGNFLLTSGEDLLDIAWLPITMVTCGFQIVGVTEPWVKGENQTARRFFLNYVLLPLCYDSFPCGFKKKKNPIVCVLYNHHFSLLQKKQFSFLSSQRPNVICFHLVCISTWISNQ